MRLTLKTLLVLSALPVVATGASVTNNGSSCPPSTNNYNVGEVSQHYVWTGQGGYVASTVVGPSTAAQVVNMTVAGIPAGATVQAAFLYTAQMGWGGNPDGGPTALFNGVNPPGGYLSGFVDFGANYGPHPIYGNPLQPGAYDRQFYNQRYDVTAQVTGNGVYTLQSPGTPFGLLSGTLVVVYEDLSAVGDTTVAIGDGMYAWWGGHNPAGVYDGGWPPRKTDLDWSCQGNPACSPIDTRFSRAGGTVGPSPAGPLNRDAVVDPVSGAIRWVSGAGVYQVGGAGPHYPDLDTYTNRGVLPGEDIFSYNMVDAILNSVNSKDEWWLNVLVHSSTCIQTTPTPTPTPVTCPAGDIMNIGSFNFGTSNTVCVEIVSPTPTIGNTETFTPTVTLTPTPTITLTPTPTVTITVTETITVTVTLTVTYTLTPTPTVTVTVWTPSPTVTFTRTPTPTFTITLTPTPTYTVTFTPTVTFTVSTPTPTITLTRTPTPTFTITLTPTPTYTLTATPTVTLTYTPSDDTPTDTPTITVTFTITVTATPTYTLTATRTVTLTDTPTETNTFSATYTPTYTITLTPTPTFTITATPTVTRTITEGPTPTWTVTPTDTATVTVTSTITFTATLTATRTLTASPTDTYTLTATRTVTPTITLTSQYTATNTPTWTLTDTPTMTDTATYTLTATRTQTATSTITRTDTPTYTVTFTSTHTLTPTPTHTFTVTRSPTYTPTHTPTYTQTPTYTFTSTLTATPTITFSFTYSHTPSMTSTLTYSPTSTTTFTNTSTYTVTPTMTPTYTITMTNTFTPTPIPMPFQFSLIAYNSAGEQVKVLFNGQASAGISEALFNTDIILGGSSPLEISFDVILSNLSNSIVWTGDNDNGQALGGGIYTLVFESTDQFGKSTTLTKAINVLNPPQQSNLTVFNSAGEIVVDINLGGFEEPIVDFRIDRPVFSPVYQAGVAPLSSTDVSIDIPQPTGGGRSDQDAAGNIYTVDPAGDIVRKIAPDGTVSIIASTSAGLNNPTDVAVDAAGNVYVVDSGNHRVIKIDTAGIVVTVAGTGTAGSGGIGGPATSAQLNNPQGIALDSAGNLYIADTGNNTVHIVNAGSGLMTTVAGVGTAGFSVDGIAATSSQLNAPQDIFVDAAGNLFIADTANHRIRMVDIGTGLISTVAGSGNQGYAGNNGPASAADLNGPGGVFVDAAGNLYIADTNNSDIRMVAAGTGIISSVAGNGIAGYAGDGSAATAANINQPQSVLLDAAGNLLIADSGNGVQRCVDAATGIIRTVAGHVPGPAATLNGPATGDIQQGSGLVIILIDSHGGEHPFEWNGVSSAGQPADSGSYTVLLNTIDQANGVSATRTFGVTLVRNNSWPAELEVITAPNPAAHEMTVFYGAGSATGAMPTGSRAQVLLYNLAGELVISASDVMGRGKLTFNVQKLASGVYIVVVEQWRDQGLLGRTTSKAVILH